MTASKPDYAANWGSLLDMFVSGSGLKLRINMLDTVLLRDGRIFGHYYTSKDGIVCKFAAHEVTRASVYQRLAAQHTLEQTNPFGYIALAHFPSGVSRHLKRPELQELLNHVCGPLEFSSSAGALDELPFCIQNFVRPRQDVRYVASFSDNEGPQIAILARKYSSRYTHAFDDPSTLIEQGVISASALGMDDTGPLSADELMVESQLVAMGLLDARAGSCTSPRMQRQMSASSSASRSSEQPLAAEASEPAILPTKRVRTEATRILQTVSSYVERAHGSRITGLVCEFIPTGPEALTLLAVHAVQLDSREGRGRLGTFTERWQDYLNGMGPAPSPQPVGTSRPTNGPSLLKSSDNALVMTERGSGLLVRTSSLSTSPSMSCAGAGPGSMPHSPSGHGHYSVHSPKVYATVSNPSPRVNSGQNSRPASAPNAQILKAGRTGNLPNSVHSSAYNGHYTLRNAMSVARPGGGGNPTATPPTPTSYGLWLPQETPPAGSVSASLALELESARERLQRQTDVAARSQAALQQLAESSRRQVHDLQAHMEELRMQLNASQEARRNAEAEFERLRVERLDLQSGRSELEAEVARLRAALASDRETLAMAMRNNSTREDALEAQLRGTRDEREEALSQLAQVTRRLEEEKEVVEAVRAQLLDYKQMVAQLQTQVRRGRNNKPLIPGASAATGAPGACSTAASGGERPACPSMAAGNMSVRVPRDDAESDAGSDVMMLTSVSMTQSPTSGASPAPLPAPPQDAVRHKTSTANGRMKVSSSGKR